MLLILATILLFPFHAECCLCPGYYGRGSSIFRGKTKTVHNRRNIFYLVGAFSQNRTDRDFKNHDLEQIAKENNLYRKTPSVAAARVNIIIITKVNNNMSNVCH